MTVKDLVKRLRVQTKISIRENNYFVFISLSDNIPASYLNRNIIDIIPLIKNKESIEDGCLVINVDY